MDAEVPYVEGKLKQIIRGIPVIDQKAKKTKSYKKLINELAKGLSRYIRYDQEAPQTIVSLFRDTGKAESEAKEVLSD